MDAAGAGCTVGQGRAAGPSLAWPSGARQNTALTHGWGEREAVVLGARGTPRGEQHGANGTKSTHGDSSLQRRRNVSKYFKAFEGPLAEERRARGRGLTPGCQRVQLEGATRRGPSLSARAQSGGPAASW